MIISKFKKLFLPSTFESLILRITASVVFLCFGTWSMILLGNYVEYFQYLVIVLQLVVVWWFVMFVSLYFFGKHGRYLWKDTIVLFLIGVAAAINGYYYHHTLVPVQDYGIYSNCAIAFADHGTFEIPVDVIYTGFLHAEYNHDVVSCGQPAGYAVFLSVFFKLGGIAWMQTANSIIFFLGLTTVYLVGMRLKNRAVGLVGVLFFGTLYPSWYFPRRTLSENLMFFLVWVGVFSFLWGVDKKKPGWVLFSWLPIAYLVITRSEGILYLATFSAAILVYLWIKWSQVSKWALATFVAIYAAVVGVIVPYLTTYAAHNQFNFFKIILEFFKQHADSVQIGAAQPGVGAEPINYVWNILLIYGVVFMIFWVLYGMISRQYKWKHLLLFLLVVPTFIFLYKPFIARGHPWSLRRAWPVLYPFFALMSAYVLVNIYRSKRFVVTLFVLLMIGFNMISSRNVITATLNRGDDDILTQAQQISELVGSDSVVLIPANYYSRAGRICSFLYFHEGVNCLVPIQGHPHNGVTYNSVEDIQETFRTWRNEKTDLFLMVDDESLALPEFVTISESNSLIGFSNSVLGSDLLGVYQYAGEVKTYEEMLWKIEQNYPPQYSEKLYRVMRFYRYVEPLEDQEESSLEEIN